MIKKLLDSRPNSRHLKEALPIVFFAPGITFVGIILFFAIHSFTSGLSRGWFFVPFIFGVLVLVYYAYLYSDLELTPVHYIRTMFLMATSIFLLALISSFIPN